MRLEDLDYDLPARLIAQHPLAERDAARLLVVRGPDGHLDDRHVRDLPDLLRPDDLMVFNDTKVLPARLWATKPDTGARIEILLLEERATNEWEALVRPARRVPPGATLEIRRGAASLLVRVIAEAGGGRRRLVFDGETDIRAVLWSVGTAPLPPYIKRSEPDPADRERYQTVYARHPGAVAAPTAGLHFTPDLLAHLQRRGIQETFVTLHVGLGTFRPLTDADIRAGRLHAERYRLDATAAAALNVARREGRRIVAVGTTVARVLESCARSGCADPFEPHEGRTDLFLQTGDAFAVVGALLTNFHLPRSSLFALVCAFAGTDLMHRAYAHAIQEGYRFYSYGDATLLCP